MPGIPTSTLMRAWGTHFGTHHSGEEHGPWRRPSQTPSGHRLACLPPLWKLSSRSSAGKVDGVVWRIQVYSYPEGLEAGSGQALLDGSHIRVHQDLVHIL